MFYKINYGYGTGLKKYSSLKGAKIAATHFMKQSGQNWICIVEFKKVLLKDISHTVLNNACNVQKWYIIESSSKQLSFECYESLKCTHTKNCKLC